MLLLKSTVALIAAVTALAGPGAASNSHAQLRAAGHQPCRHVTIQGKRACLAPGRYCTRQWEHAYRGCGYSCSVIDRTDRYHLRRVPRH
jgi:uncharacterized membrane protein